MCALLLAALLSIGVVAAQPMCPSYNYSVNRTSPQAVNLSYSMPYEEANVTVVYSLNENNYTASDRLLYTNDAWYTSINATVPIQSITFQFIESSGCDSPVYNKTFRSSYGGTTHIMPLPVEGDQSEACYVGPLWWRIVRELTPPPTFTVTMEINSDVTAIDHVGLFYVADVVPSRPRDYDVYTPLTLASTTFTTSFQIDAEGNGSLYFQGQFTYTVNGTACKSSDVSARV